MRSGRWAGIEAGGTKFVAAVGSGPEDLARVRFDTVSPEETLRSVTEWLQDNGPFDAVGVGAFGPLDLESGTITTTPKLAWRGFALKKNLEDALGVPVVVDTDVNAAALGEHCWGAARGVKSFLYMTIGTGIGGGAMVDGRLLHGRQHPEMGHLVTPLHPLDREFEGVCPSHGTCLEGVASGPALEARWGKAARELPAEHPAWEHEAFYLGFALANFIYAFSPERIILGGGVMEQGHLYPAVQERVETILNGYVAAPPIIPPEQPHCGVLGALALARGAGG
ncbi:MAG: ROK family protein [Bryobacteraceae bacterium]|nr:ROK family protein [Bryobacteraceae bacterium]